MRVTVAVAGEDTREVEIDEGATYADLLDPLPYSAHEVSVLVDGRPVPEDAPVETDAVEVLRLVKGG
ncbi:ubiquitin-like small modifier protein SAMP2 [Halosimplex sp. TS25]|uniref:ubiquitin-like small modifier protein SAMP2 n=1 Tax=Halosimplex rarum TaxID=3396619 RepID=UPI0039E8332D